MKCPLCLKKMVDNDIGLWECDQMVNFNWGKPLPHYKLDIEIGTESMVVFPYKIVSHIYGDSKKNTSRIFIYHDPKNPNNYLSRRFKGLKTVPQIHSDTSVKLLERIKKLLIFL